jgi:uncharacterized protein YigE (DUF2233 family)
LKHKILILVTIVLGTIFIYLFYGSKNSKGKKNLFFTYMVNPKEIKLYFKNEQQINFSSIENLKNWLAQKNETLVFAMNAGMYKPDNTPQGLYIENHTPLFPIDTSTGIGNFYMKPNGVFYIDVNNDAKICATQHFTYNNNIKYATQSGPMLVIDGKIHDSFKVGSNNLNIRNGVGILPNNEVLFAMSKKEINFYDFAQYFKEQGCVNALYLDGLVSRTYLPEKKWIQLDGNFGVIIGVTKK